MKKRILLVAMAMMCAVGVWAGSNVRDGKKNPSTPSLHARSTRKLSLEVDTKEAQAEFSKNVYTPTYKEPKMMVQEWHGGTSSRVYYIKYACNGKYMLTAADDIKIWDTETSLLIKTFPGSAYHGSVDFSPDGKFYSYMVKDENLKEYYMVISSVLDDKVVFKNPVRDSASLKFSPDGNRFCIQSNKYAVFYNMKSFKQEFFLSFKDYTFGFESNICFSDDSRYFSAIFTDYSYSYNVTWDLTTRKFVSVYQQKRAASSSDTIKILAISPDNKYVACATSNETIFIHKLSQNELYRQIDAKERSGWFENQAIAFIPNTNNIMVNHHNCNTYAIWNYESGEEVYKSPEFPHPGCFTFAISNNRNECAFSGLNVIYFFSLSSNEKIRELRNPNADAYSRFCEKQLFFTDDRVRVSDYQKAFVLNPETLETKKMKYTLRGSKIYSDGVFFRFSDTNNIHRYSFDLDKVDDILPEDSERIIDWWFSSYKGNVVAYKDKGGNDLNVYEVSSGKFIKKISKGEVPINGSLCFSAGGNFVFSTFPKNIMINLVTGDKRTFIGHSPNFSLNDKYCYMRNVKEGDFLGSVIYETNNWRAVRKIKYTDLNEKSDATYTKPFSHDEESIAFLKTDPTGAFVCVEIQDVKTGKIKASIKTNISPHEAGGSGTAFSSDDKNIIVRHANKVEIYSIEKKALLVTVIADVYGDWLAYTPEGFFTGSENGINRFVHLVDGMKVFELGQMYDVLYRPDLVQAKLQGKSVGKPLLQEIVAAGDAPRVAFARAPSGKSRQATLEFSVQDMGGGIGYVYLSHNGKAIQISKGEDRKVGRKYIYSCDITLAPGENVFEAYASNFSNKIESRHSFLRLYWDGTVEKGDLYVLTMGVDKYSRMPKNNLMYSVADATAIADSFKTAPGGLYGSVNIMTLLDSDVNQDNIQKAFDLFAAKVKPDDTFVLHIAGHGVNYDGEYYYLPADTLAKTEADFAKQGVSKRFLTENLSKLQALNVVLLLDTCYSGAFIDAKTQGNSLAQKTALERLAHTSGQVILTASANSQTAGEGWKGHGIFTYAIIEALAGKANHNVDNAISVKEIAQYISSEIPNIYQAMGQPRQSPWISTLRGDFNVVSTGGAAPSPWNEVAR